MGAQIGEWGRYDRQRMRAAIESSHAWPRGAVIKPATDGGSVGLMLLSGVGRMRNGSLLFRAERHDGTRWRRGRWSLEGVLAHAESLVQISASSSRWRQRFEHRGVMVQQRYLCGRGECGLQPNTPARQLCGRRAARCLLEVKAHVVFGRLSCIVVEQVPVAFNSSLYVTVRDSSAVDCSASDASKAELARVSRFNHSEKLEELIAFSCEHFMTFVRPQLPTLADTAAKVAINLGADWFRLDLFLGHPQLGLQVNEITYPSHVQDTCALQQWLRKYRELTLRPFAGEVAFRRISRMIGIDNHTFHRSDFV